MAKAVGLVEAPALGTDLPLDVRGTAFQERVWQALRAIPAGKTASYAEVARRVGSPARCAPWRKPAPRTRSRSRFRAIAWCAPTASSPATAGASSASASCCGGKRGDAIHIQSLPPWGGRAQREVGEALTPPTSAVASASGSGPSPLQHGRDVETELNEFGYAVSAKPAQRRAMRRACRAVRRRHPLPQPRGDGAAQFRPRRIQIFLLSAAGAGGDVARGALSAARRYRQSLARGARCRRALSGNACGIPPALP